MTRKRSYPWIVAIPAMLVLGCVSNEPFFFEPSASTSLLEQVEGSLDTSVRQASAQEPLALEPSESLTPFSIRGATSVDWQAPEPWDLSIDEVIQIALANSSVLRDLGARVIQAPSLTPTIYGPAIQATDPRAGVEAALSEFDAQLTADLFFEDNDRVLNNEFLGGGVNFFRQDLARFQTGITKQAASGTIFELRHNVEGDLNNAERNLVPGRAWSWNLEGEVRQPLLQGRGVGFNRIAGPNSVPGVFNGVVIALLDADSSTAQLEIALRDYLSDVENAYWDLYYAYQDLQVKTRARDRSLDTLRLLTNRSNNELPGAERDKVKQAEEQYYRFEEAVQDALGGRLLLGTRAFNGSGGGTFQGIGGVYASERRLRLIMGLPINDGRLIHTISQTPEAPTVHDWNEVAGNALTRRTELRRQQLLVQRRSFELAASRNFTLPRLDAVGRYRYRGLGEQLYATSIDGIGTDTHEWLLGLSLAYPIGYRQAFAGVRNAQLRLARERELLTELERQVMYGVSNAVAEKDRAYEVMRLAMNRRTAANEQYTILSDDAQSEIRQFDFNALLDAERRLAEAETNVNRAAVQYALATKNLNFEMGTLLEYFNIHLASGRTPRRRLPPGTQWAGQNANQEATQSAQASSSQSAMLMPVSTTNKVIPAIANKSTRRPHDSDGTNRKVDGKRNSRGLHARAGRSPSMKIKELPTPAPKLPSAAPSLPPQPAQTSAEGENVARSGGR